MTSAPHFATIRTTSEMGFITQHNLRLRVKQGKCPGYYAGNRFMVNVSALIELLEEESRENVKR